MIVGEYDPDTGYVREVEVPDPAPTPAPKPTPVTTTPPASTAPTSRSNRRFLVTFSDGSTLVADEEMLDSLYRSGVPYTSITQMEGDEVVVPNSPSTPGEEEPTNQPTTMTLGGKTYRLVDSGMKDSAGDPVYYWEGEDGSVYEADPLTRQIGRKLFDGKEDEPALGDHGVVVNSYYDEKGNLIEEYEDGTKTTTAPKPKGQPKKTGSFTDSNGVMYDIYMDDDGNITQEEVGYDPTKDTRTTKDTTSMGLDKERLEWEKESESNRLAAEKEQRLATLKANPGSWLEYSALSGVDPVVQPWMQPLAPSDYNAKVGETLPGWSENGAAGKTNLTELITPGAQYSARMSPDMRAQYYAYEKARTGQTPESTQWRLWSRAPGAGKATQLNYTK